MEGQGKGFERGEPAERAGRDSKGSRGWACNLDHWATAASSSRGFGLMGLLSRTFCVPDLRAASPYLARSGPCRLTDALVRARPDAASCGTGSVARTWAGRATARPRSASG